MFPPLSIPAELRVPAKRDRGIPQVGEIVHVSSMFADLRLVPAKFHLSAGIEHRHAAWARDDGSDRSMSSILRLVPGRNSDRENQAAAIRLSAVRTATTIGDLRVAVNYGRRCRVVVPIICARRLFRFATAIWSGQFRLGRNLNRLTAAA